MLFPFCRCMAAIVLLFSVAAIVMLFMGGFMFMLLCFVMGSCNLYGVFLSVAAIFMISLLWVAAIFMLFYG